VILALSKEAFRHLFAMPDLEVGRFCLLGRYFDLPGAHIGAFYMSGRLSSSIDLQRFQSDGRVRDDASSIGPRIRPRVQAMYWPPLTDRVEPVMKPASSPARKSTLRAISSASPRRPTGISGRIFDLSTSSGTARTISVAM
jgi:hypothetical protein